MPLPASPHCVHWISARGLSDDAMARFRQMNLEIRISSSLGRAMDDIASNPPAMVVLVAEPHAADLQEQIFWLRGVAPSAYLRVFCSDAQGVRDAMDAGADDAANLASIAPAAAPKPPALAQGSVADIRVPIMRLPSSFGRDAHDPSALLDGHAFRNRMATALGRSRTQGTPMTVCRIDFSGLAAVSQGLGQWVHAGLMTQIADILSRAVRPGDSVAQLDDERFALLIEGASDAKIYAISQQVRNELSGFEMPGKLRVTAGMRILGSRGDTTLPELVRALEGTPQAPRPMPGVAPVAEDPPTWIAEVSSSGSDLFDAGPMPGPRSASPRPAPAPAAMPTAAAPSAPASRTAMPTASSPNATSASSPDAMPCAPTASADDRESQRAMPFPPADEDMPTQLWDPDEEGASASSGRGEWYAISVMTPAPAP